MTFQEAQQYLDSFINHETHLGQVDPASFKTKRVKQLLEHLGCPHKDLKIIHVAGSKGKGSVCVLTASILQACGYKVGLYTSPHVNHYRERIRVLNPKSTPGVGLGCSDIFPDCISEEELCSTLAEMRPAVEKTRLQKGLETLTFFEVYTALALCYFQKQKTDFAVLETGLGGRLDATNAADSIVAAITPISLEHTKILGDTITKIAQEKAAIIKDHRQKVVIGIQDAGAEKVLEKRCREFAIDPIWVKDHVTCEAISKDIDQQMFHLTTPKMTYGHLQIPLLGKHQRDKNTSFLERCRRKRRLFIYSW